MKRPSLIAPNDLADNLISQLKSGQRIKPFEVGQLLAVIKRAHEEFGERDACGDLVDVKIPFALLDIIGAAMLERTNWQRAEARKRKGRPKRAAALHLRAIRAEADKVRAEHPRFRNNDSLVAKMVVKRLDGKLTRWGPNGVRVPVKLNRDTVRRQISLTR